MADDWLTVGAIDAVSRIAYRDRHGDIAGGSLDDRRGEAVRLVTAMIRGYTRGQGFDAEGVPAPDLRAVIVTATLRFLSNPNGLEAEGSGSGARQYRGENLGLTLLERQVCDRYRVTAK